MKHVLYPVLELDREDDPAIVLKDAAGKPESRRALVGALLVSSVATPQTLPDGP